MKHLFFLVAFLLFTGKSFAIDYDSVFYIITDKSKPFDERYALLVQHQNYLSVEHSFASQKQLAWESKKMADIDKTISLISNLVRSLSQYEEHVLAKAYLDSLLVLENIIDDYLNKAKLFDAAGTYYASLAQTAQAHEYLYKALENYEKTGKFHEQQIALLYSIAIPYIHENDTASIRNIIEKMEPLTKQDNTFKSHFLAYTIIGSYYDMLFDLDKEQLNYIDSVLFYNLKIIRQYEMIENPPVAWALNISYNYLGYANYKQRLPNPDWDVIIQYIEKAVEINPYDPYIQILYHRLYASYHSKLRQLDRALKESMTSLQMLTEQNNEEWATMYVDAYNQLSEIHELRKEYEQALKYERLSSEVKIKIYNKERHQIVKNLQTRYEVAKKEENIQHLTEQNRYRESISRLYLGMLILIALVCIFVILWFRGKRKADIGKLQITKLQSYLEGLESERSRLAKEMHDHVSNGLLALEAKMQSSGVSAELTDMAHVLQQQVRYISHALIPPVFQYVSLPEIIDHYIREQNWLEGPCFQFYLAPEEGWEDLPHQMALDLYRIVQETCSNAIKHADAKNIVISLSRKKTLLELSITDDGQGFQIADVIQGIGLQTINERAANQNGVVTIDSSPGKGTVIQLRIKNLHSPFFQSGGVSVQ